MQKSTTVLSAPLDDLEIQLRDVESWPQFLPDLVAVDRVSEGRYVFTVRLDGQVEDVPVIVRRSPRGHGLLWTVLEGPAWNGHLYLEAVDARRTRAHLELVVEPRALIGAASLARAGRPVPALHRLQDVAGHPPATVDEHDEDDIIVLPVGTD